jgi:ssDNA-binding Zn-finger/Zn-ribbon topoisomerase 1
MHSYMKGVGYMLFRCSDYPQCKTYLKVSEVEIEVVDTEMISKELSIKHFIREIEGKPTWEALYHANEEGTAA